MKFCSLNWHYRSQWKPNQVNRVSKRIIVDFSGLRTGSEQEQALEASMPYSEGQSTAVPTAPKLCFKLSTTKSVCRVSEVQQPPGSCRPSSDALQQDCEVLPSNAGMSTCVCQEGHGGRGWPGEGLCSPSELPSTFMSHSDREAGSGQELKLSRPHHVSSLSPSMALDAWAVSPADAKLLLYTAAPVYKLLNASRIPVIPMQIP